MVEIKFSKAVEIDQLREVLVLAENQETTDRFENTSMQIDGDYAKIEVEIDTDGNITVL